MSQVKNRSINLKSNLRNLVILSKPRLTFLVVFTLMVGRFFSTTSLEIEKLMVLLIASLFLVGGTCILNCVFEFELDTLMKRTESRSQIIESMGLNKIFWIALNCICLSLICLLIFINTTTALLGLLASSSYLLLYTPLKVISPLSLFAGAIPGAIPPVMGLSSAENTVNIVGIFLFGIMFIWQVPHFLALSILYGNDYNKAKIRLFNLDYGIKFTQNLMAISVLYLMAWLVYFQLNIQVSLIGQIITVILTLIFLISTLKGYFTVKNEDIKKWSKSVFLYSVIYLPLLFINLIIFKAK